MREDLAAERKVRIAPDVLSNERVIEDRIFKGVETIDEVVRGRGHGVDRVAHA
jgi:hypothetical protein